MASRTYKYFKSRIKLLIFVFFISAIAFFGTKDDAKADTYENAYLCCFIDDTSNTYRTQVIYSGSNVELGNVSHLFNNEALNVYPNGNGVYNGGRIPLYQGVWNRQSVTYDGNSYSTELILDDKGMFNLKLTDKNGNVGADDGKQGVKIYDDTTIFQQDNNLINEISHTPCSFPALCTSRTANASDINRAYEVQDALGGEFMDALIFLNDGENYTSVEELVQTAYFLVTSTDGTTIKNSNGTIYTLDWNDETQTTNGSYVYHVTIRRKTADGLSTDSQQSFTYGVKKGYNGCSRDDETETGAKNTLNLAQCSKDTVYITYEHLFTNAGVLYENGITYANQGDIFQLSDMESKVIEITRNCFTGLRSMLQLYSMEDCIFNLGVRGSSAFVYGIYNTSWSYNINMIMLAFTTIVISLIAFSVARLVLSKQFALISPAYRLSLIDGFKNIALSILFIAFVFLAYRFIFIINYEFVEIFAKLIGDRKLSESLSYSTLASIVYQIAYFIITLYVNVIYIIRGLFVPALMMISPFTIYAFNLGKTGQEVTSNWLKELLGYVFIQSVHAFVYGVCLISFNGLRGIESLVLCASIIPLTTMVKNIFKLGADNMLKSASSLAGAMSSVGFGVASAGISMAGNVVGGVASGIGTAVGGVGATVGNVVSTATKGVGNVASGGITALGGAGLSTALGGDETMWSNKGAGMVESGASKIGSNVGNVAEAVGQGVVYLGKPAISGLMSGAGAVKNFNEATNTGENLVLSSTSGVRADMGNGAIPISARPSYEQNKNNPQISQVVSDYQNLSQGQGMVYSEVRNMDVSRLSSGTNFNNVMSARNDYYSKIKNMCSFSNPVTNKDGSVTQTMQFPSYDNYKKMHPAEMNNEVLSSQYNKERNIFNNYFESMTSTQRNEGTKQDFLKMNNYSDITAIRNEKGNFTGVKITLSPATASSSNNNGQNV